MTHGRVTPGLLTACLRSARILMPRIIFRVIRQLTRVAGCTISAAHLRV
jgi:hypothetical protein